MFFVLDEYPIPTIASPERLLLLDAAQTLERHKHCKGLPFDEDDGMCWYAAIYSARARHADARMSKITDALTKVTGAIGLTGQFRWSDAPERTKEEVVAAMRAAAAAI